MSTTLHQPMIVWCSLVVSLVYIKRRDYFGQRLHDVSSHWHSTLTNEMRRHALIVRCSLVVSLVYIKRRNYIGRCRLHWTAITRRLDSLVWVALYTDQWDETSCSDVRHSFVLDNLTRWNKTTSDETRWRLISSVGVALYTDQWDETSYNDCPM